jgi:hypothetical protein
MMARLFQKTQLSFRSSSVLVSHGSFFDDVPIYAVRKEYALSSFIDFSRPMSKVEMGSPFLSFTKRLRPFINTQGAVSLLRFCCICLLHYS